MLISLAPVNRGSGSWLMPVLFVFSAMARADNAALTAGGHPKMMDHHPQISMASEVVNLVVSRDLVRTDATFVFHNSGKACRAKMGFPDFGLWAYAYPSKKASTIFKTYHSYVGGKAVTTKLVLGAAPGEQWQVKEVAFPSNGNVKVREIYTTEVGGIAQEITIATAAYLLHTGASWKGPIGSATIKVRFEANTELATPLKPQSSQPPLKAFGQVRDRILQPGGVFVLGPCAPEVNGRTLTFNKTNWTPKKDEDLYIFYRYPPKYIEEIKAKYRRKLKP